MRCKYCGAKNKKGVKFCGSCGKPMNIKKTKGELDNKSAKEKGKKHRKWWIVIAGVLLLAAGGGYTAFSLLRQAKLSQYQDLLQEANLLLEDEKTDEAVLKFSDAINFLKGQSEAYESLCQVYLDMGDVVAADNLLSQSPEKVKNELADISEEIEEEMSSTFLKTEYTDGENIYYGITTLAGEEILPCIYDDISWDQEKTFDVPVIFTVEKDGYFGYIDEEGTAVTDIIYDELEYDFMGKDFIKDYAVVCCDGQYGIVGRDGTYLLEPEYENIYSLGFIGDMEYFEFTNHLGGIDIIKSTGERTDFQNTYRKAERIDITEDTLINEDSLYPQIDTLVRGSDYFCMVDGNNAVILDKNLSIIEDNIDYILSFYDFDRYIVLRFNDGKERIYDYDFKPVVQNSFDNITVAYLGGTYMHTERFAVQNGDIIYVYGSDGTEEYSFQTDYSLSEMYQGTEDDIFIVHDVDGGKDMLMNSNGELINGEKYGWVRSLDNMSDYRIDYRILNRDFLAVTVNGLWGVINYNTGEYIVPPEYDWINIISSGAFSAYDYVTGENTIINLQGEKLFSGNYYSYWGNLLSDKILSEDEALRGVIDINGNIILPTEYKSIDAIFNDSHTKVIRYEVVREDGKTGVVDTHGEEIIPVEYDEIIQVSDTEYAVKQEGSWALINTQGKIQIPFGTFDKIGAGDEKNHLVKVQKENQFGYADNKGNWVICFQDGESKY